MTSFKKTKRHAIKWKKTFKIHISEKGLLSGKYKETFYLNIKTDNPIKNGQQIGIFHQRNRFQITHEKILNISVTREMQIKMTRYYYTPIRTALRKKHEVPVRMETLIFFRWKYKMVKVFFGKLSVSCKYTLTTWPSNPTSRYFPR